MLWSLAIPGGEIQWNRTNGASLQLLRQWCHKDKWSYFLLSGTIGFCLSLNEKCFCVESRDGALVRELASHQCGPGSISGLGVICGLSLICCCFSSLLRGFFSGYSDFTLSSKANISKFQFYLASVANKCSALITVALK